MTWASSLNPSGDGESAFRKGHLQTCSYHDFLCPLALSLLGSRAQSGVWSQLLAFWMSE